MIAGGNTVAPAPSATLPTAAERLSEEPIRTLGVPAGPPGKLLCVSLADMAGPDRKSKEGRCGDFLIFIEVSRLMEPD
jgi:hypothetical protein